MSGKSTYIHLHFGASRTFYLTETVFKFPVGRFDDEKMVIDVWPGIMLPSDKIHVACPEYPSPLYE